MQLSAFHLFAAATVAAAAPLVLTACASSSDSSDASESTDGSEDVGSSEDELSTFGQQSFVGEFEWKTDESGTLVDFEQVEFKADGSYTAKVEATLVNAAVRCFRFPCTLPEQGSWNAYKVAGKTKLRVRPSTGRARVYSASISADAQTLTLSRRGETTKLFREARITCANVRCAAGTHCEMTGQPKAPKCVQNKASQITCANVRCAAGTHCEMTGVPAAPQCVPEQAPCVKTGCSGHVCSDHDVITTCEFRPEYACYQQATCERQGNGQCGWTQTPALTACLADN